MKDITPPSLSFKELAETTVTFDKASATLFILRRSVRYFRAPSSQSVLPNVTNITACNDTNIGTNFYVLLTVHLGSILVNNQLDAQLFFRIYLFQ